MKTLKTMLFAFMLCVGIAGCAKQEDLQPEESYSFDEILGKWTVVSQSVSDGSLVPVSDGQFYDFKKDKTCTYYSGSVLDTYDQYEFGYDPNKKVILLRHARGWDLIVDVDFKNDNEAMLHINGKTTNSDKTVRVKRN